MGYRLCMVPMTSRDRMTSYGDVTLYFFKMLLVRQFLSELDTILIRIGQYFNTTFPNMVYLYGPHG